MEDQIIERLDALGNTLWKTRKKAIEDRAASGIEDEWTRAEESYAGIDDANRDTEAAPAYYKPSGVDGAFSTRKRVSDTRSKVFLNITRPYVDSAAARIGDMLLPVDDAPWVIEATPIPFRMAPLPGEVAQAAAAIEADSEAAKPAAELATVQMKDWLDECHWARETRRAIDDCARLGTGVLKGPTPAKRTSRRATEAGIELVEEIVPESRWISPWRCYPDMSCGENIQNGAYFWEYDEITAKTLRQMIGNPGVIEDQVRKVLELGPSHDPDVPSAPSRRTKDSDVFAIWYCYTTLEADDLRAAGVDIDDDTFSAAAMLAVVNGVVVRAAMNPLDSGEFPYDFMVWQVKHNLPFGSGVAHQVSAPQRMLNAGTRTMNENLGLSAAPQVVIRRGILTPADGKWALTRGKVWFVNESADVQAVDQAFRTFDIPTRQNELMGMITFALKMAEDITGLPMLMQGQVGNTTPDTVGGMLIQTANASATLRRLARTFDGTFVSGHIGRYFEWMQVYSDNDAAKSGDLRVVARGATALLERDMNNQAILGMGSIVLNPAFGIDPELWAEEMMRAQRLEPKRFALTEEKKKAMQAPPPPDTAIQVAQIRSDAELQKAALANETAQLRIQKDTDRDTVYTQAEMARSESAAQSKREELMIRREVAMLEYANKEKISLETLKTRLAETALKLSVQKELAGLPGADPELVKPPTEPPQHAADGRAFEQ